MENTKTRGRLRKKVKLPLLVSALVTVIAGFSGAAVAAEDVSETAGNFQIEEVLVTARKRAESIQDVPIAVTAITDALQDTSIQNFLDLEGIAPNVQIREGMMRAGGSSITIRGIGYYNDEKSLDSPVGVLIDGVYMGFTTGQLLDNFDLESVEILRGPQGTLYGKNTIGGVVSARRSLPTGEMGGKLSLSGGSFGRADIKAIFNTPIIEDVLAAKVFVAKLTTDGDKFNSTLGKDTNKQDYLNYGGAFLFTPNEDLEVLLTVEKFDDGSDNGAIANFNGLSADESKYNLNGKFGEEVYFKPLITAFFGDGVLAVNDKGSSKNSVSTDRENLSQSETDAVTLQATYELDDNMTVTYIFGDRDGFEDASWDFDGTSAAFTFIENWNWTEQTSHELRLDLTYDNADIVLGYYRWESAYTQDWVTSDLWNYIADKTTTCGADLALCPLTGGHGQRIYQSQDNEADAIFGQIDYQLTDQIELTAGLRYTEEVKRFFAQEGVFVADGIRDDSKWTKSQNFDPYEVEELTWKFGVAYQMNEDFLLYSSVTKGFHSGGYYGKNQKLSDFANTYEPEFNTSLELGFKADLMDGRVRLNGAVFESNLKDKQESAIVTDPRTNSVVTIMTNVGEVTYRGIEAELEALITENWNVSLTVGILDAEYDEFFVDINGVNAAGVLEPTDNTYLTPKMAADGNFSLRSSYDFSMAGGDATANISYSWNDEYYTRIQNNPVSLVPAFGKVNASLGFKINNFGVSIYGNNLTDKQYANVWDVQPLMTFGQWSQGRSYGITVDMAF